MTVTATTVKERQLPDADDDFAQLASEFDTLEELTADLREQASQIKISNQAVQARDLLLEQLLAGTEIPVPAGVVEAEVHRHLEGEGRLEDDEHRAEVGEQATTALRNQILLDTLAEQLEIKVSQNELLDYLVNASRQYGMDPNTFIQTIDQQGQIPTMVAEVARSKALAVALRRVAVTDASGKAVDLSEFIGSDAEDAAEEPAQQAAVLATSIRRRERHQPSTTCTPTIGRRGRQGLTPARKAPHRDDRCGALLRPVLLGWAHAPRARPQLLDLPRRLRHGRGPDARGPVRPRRASG